MARDIEADAKVNDKSGPGLDSFARNVRNTGKKVEKDFDRFGKSTGEKLLNGIGAVSPKLAAKLASSFGDAAKLGAPLLVSGIAAAAPAISALMGAAVTGGAAGLGIIGGVALASRDARVKAAGTNLAATLLAGLQDRAGSFVQPVLNSLKIVESAFVRNGETIRRIFTNSAKFVEPLATSLGNLGTSLIEGLDIAIGRAGPVMESLNRGIERVGEAVKSFLSSMSENGESNAKVLESAFTSVAVAIEVTGEALSGLAKVLGFLDGIMPLSTLETFNKVLGDTEKGARRTGSGTFGAAQAMQVAGDSAETAAADTKLYEKALADNAKAAQDAANAQRSLFDDTTRVAAAMDDAKAAARANGKTLDENTKKGRANREAISSLASAMNGYRTNLTASGASTTKVNGVMAQQRAALIRVAGQMGKTGGEARRLADQLLGIPPKRETKTGLLNEGATKREARAVAGAVRSIPSTKNVTITVITRYKQYGLKGPSPLGGAVGLSGSDAGFALSDPNGGTFRVGGPVEVFSTIENRVFLDGRPFREYTDRQVRASEDRARHRARYGGRLQ